MEHVLKARVGRSASRRSRRSCCIATTAALVGPLPAEVQNYTSYAAGVMTRRAASAAAQELRALPRTPAAKKVFVAAGIE
jgi:hypothetical protein